MIIKNKAFDKKKISAKYINRYISLNSSAEMQELNLFPNVKEIQESFALWDIINWFILPRDETIKRDSESLHVYVIGDGHTPRTAGLIAFMSKWMCVSVDPEMREDKYKNTVKRLWPVKCKGEEIEKYKLFEQSTKKPTHIILIFPHSHIKNTNEVYKHFQDQKVWIVNMPCCVKSQDDNLPLKKFFGYKDEFIDSPENVIKIYSNYIDLS